MTKPPKDRPDHVPRGFEWLPDAYHRDIEPLGEEALEQIRQTLAEGAIAAKLRTPYGERHAIPDRMWDKDEVVRKVYRRFVDGWMVVKYGPDKTPVGGWVCVHKRMWAQAVAAFGQQKSPALFSGSKFWEWYEGHVRACEAKGVIPSRDDDVVAAREQFNPKVPKYKVYEARRELAPAHWTARGRRKTVKE